MTHICHAKECNRSCPPRMLMCKQHWLMVPMLLRDEVWRTYVRGQENTKTPTAEYLSAAQSAINAVARKEGK